MQKTFFIYFLLPGLCRLLSSSRIRFPSIYPKTTKTHLGMKFVNKRRLKKFERNSPHHFNHKSPWVEKNQKTSQQHLHTLFIHLPKDYYNFLAYESHQVGCWKEKAKKSNKMIYHSGWIDLSSSRICFLSIYLKISTTCLDIKLFLSVSD